MNEEFTLKNRPKIYYAMGLCFVSNDGQEWFEGFEKQEQERLKWAIEQKSKILFLPSTLAQRAYFDGYIQAKREVLGEEASEK